MLYVYVNRRCTEAEFEVRHISLSAETLSVNLTTRECSCRKWFLTGLPCVHDIASMRFMELDFYQFVPEEYRKERYEECYRPIFHPVNGKALWERTAYTDLQSPPIKRQPGRPKKKRNKDPSELLREDGQMKRASYETKCSRCHQPGHNKATCKLPPPPPAANQYAENPPTANQTNANPSPQPAGNPPHTTSLNQTNANPLPASQQQSTTQASTNSQAPVATQVSSIAQPSGSSQANKQAAKSKGSKKQGET